MRWYHALLLTGVAVTVGMCGSMCLHVVAPPDPEIEYVYVNRTVPCPHPTYTPYPTLTPYVVTTEGVECPPSPTCAPPKVSYVLKGVVSRWGEDVEVYETAEGCMDKDPTEWLGNLPNGTEVYIHEWSWMGVRITFDVPWGKGGWVVPSAVETTQ